MFRMPLGLFRRATRLFFVEGIKEFRQLDIEPRDMEPDVPGGKKYRECPPLIFPARMMLELVNRFHRGVHKLERCDSKT